MLTIWTVVKSDLYFKGLVSTHCASGSENHWHHPNKKCSHLTNAHSFEANFSKLQSLDLRVFTWG